MSLALVDFSNLASMCWYPALSAQEVARKELAEHGANCLACQSIEPCETARGITQYDAQKVLRTNLSLKLNTLLPLIEIPLENWVFVKDGHAKDKYEKYPAYKGNRDPNRYDPCDLAEKYLRELAPTSRWVISQDHEADDTIASMAMMASRSGVPAVVVSSDKDLWSLLQYPDVHVYSSAHKAFIGPEHITKAFGVTHPKYIMLCKSLWGDSGDNVPNAVPRMQKQLVPVIEASDGSLNDFLAKTEAFHLTDRCKQLLAQGQDQVRINEFLVRLSTDIVPSAL
jgi:5'-3' exonuclease